jgi:hypothetical protein
VSEDFDMQAGKEVPDMLDMGDSLLNLNCSPEGHFAAGLFKQPSAR